MAASPRNGDGSAGTEPPKQSAAAEKATSTFITLPRSDQLYVNSDWFLFLVQIVRACVRDHKRVPRGTYDRLLFALDAFVHNERADAKYMDVDLQLGYWIFGRKTGNRRNDLPYHPILERDFGPFYGASGESRGPGNGGSRA
jgi:hypothetical protein